ncbi:hypothetical protein LG819_000586 [Vibrio parahaemolyticus]|uniref:hypothetical protein n=1 Tax=Vibrio parahaemolyticus TaxID=670 RepID=UPI0004D44C40|nr:hypothetical protein [Vibrio parahaemolyticus]EGQ7893077.1 hypothetical protein [Vibrio parahaemolyticus]EGQ8480838.1 hypothetical protein [Vibrio parahaemolyticus]EGR1279336.1 hypothetical protein [Vibrio parahaemolyticus]EGR1788351.1 hypothetical protein [Vibrio parahaemolyticus]EGR1934357.1 hypothetical protein [Vibrio parahaemolyticus]
MVGRPTKRSRKRDEAYFDAIKNGATIKQAADIAGYSYQAVMKYKQGDSSFASRHNAAMDSRFELYKEKAHEAMMHGFKEKQVITKDGKRTTIVTNKENAAHVKFMLKAHEAGKFNYEKIIKGNDEDLPESEIESRLEEKLAALLEVDLNETDARE